ncbi:MAG: DUF5060 domain-containing protein [Phycisphaerales bacterium]|nr:MAG: DUF5060 domain-containing protein [Phycisphaerales bacterium]
MRRSKSAIQIILLSLMAVCLCAHLCTAQRQLDLRLATRQVRGYEKLQMTIGLDTHYQNPFDPDQVDLQVLLTAPSNSQIALPAFYCQDFERRKLNQGRQRNNWYYPTGEGTWKVRFAPTETGTYVARARLKDSAGIAHSQSVTFECTPSARKGFLRVGRQDPRFLQFSDGTPFFAIGQNLAFIGEGQYVNLTKAEQIFAELSRNGANFLRIWTCCEDWAMAIEARKSAWDRSWHRRKELIVPVPTSDDEQSARKCVRLEGADATSISASPSHPVAVRPQASYVLTGQFRADGPRELRITTGRHDWKLPCNGDSKNRWNDFKCEFVTGDNDLWLANVTFSLVGSGTVWLDRLSLKEVGGSAELLWEADVNRPTRGYYNQIDCFMLDELVEAAEQNGIYLMLCLVTRDLYMKSLSDDRSGEYEQAIEDAKKLIRYAVARWGYSTSVAAWEYFNEIDPGLPTDRFYAEVGGYLEQTDIYHHLRTTSTWHPSARDCRHAQLDIGQLHHYMRPETKEDFRNEVAVVMDKIDFLRKHAPDKPVLIGEFGLATPKWGLSDYMKQDDKGIHFHNSLWASTFAGASGTAMFWWWDQLDKQDAYGHYRPLATFLRDVSFSGLWQLKAAASKERLRLLGHQGDDRAYIWIFDSQATWHSRVVEQQTPKQIEETTIEIRGLTPGDYSVTWWDTQKGQIALRQHVTCAEEPLRLTVPPFRCDIACKLECQSR